MLRKWLLASSLTLFAAAAAHGKTLGLAGLVAEGNPGPLGIAQGFGTTAQRRIKLGILILQHRHSALVD